MHGKLNQNYFLLSPLICIFRETFFEYEILLRNFPIAKILNSWKLLNEKRFLYKFIFIEINTMNFLKPNFYEFLLTIFAHLVTLKKWNY